MEKKSDLPESADAKSLRVMVVEDEGLTAMMLEEMLEELGHTVACRSATLDDALRALDSLDPPPQAVLLDANLNGETPLRLVERLNERNIPVLLASGYSPEHLRQRGLNEMALTKPFRMNQLRDALVKVTSGT